MLLPLIVKDPAPSKPVGTKGFILTIPLLLNTAGNNGNVKYPLIIRELAESTFTKIESDGRKLLTIVNPEFIIFRVSDEVEETFATVALLVMLIVVGVFINILSIIVGTPVGDQLVAVLYEEPELPIHINVAPFTSFKAKKIVIISIVKIFISFFLFYYFQIF